MSGFFRLPAVLVVLLLALSILPPAVAGVLSHLAADAQAAAASRAAAHDLPLVVIVTDTPRPTPTATATPVVPHGLTPLDVHIGPGDDYVIVGTVASGRDLDVVGRDKSGAWLAIVFPPGSTLNAWVPARLVSGVDDVTVLPVAPITLLPSR